MKYRGPFNIPTTPKSNFKGVRATYAKVWNLEWPHDDEYLLTLAREVPMRLTGQTRCQFLLDRMREDHDFGENLQGIGFVVFKERS